MKKHSFLKKAVLCVVAVVLLAGAGMVYALNHQDIPKLYFEGNISEMLEKTDTRNISVRYLDKENSFEGYAELKVQGTSSLSYDKKNYTIKFYSDSAHEEKLKVDVGWGAQSKYCLKANWIDRTHARNIVSARLAAQVQEKYGILTEAPRNGLIDGFPVEVYSNGDFLGLYTFNIPKDAWQFAMDEDDPDHIVICGEKTGLVTQFRERVEKFGPWSVEVGEESDATLAKVQRLSDFIMNSTDEEFTQELEAYIHKDAMLNYCVLLDVGYMADNICKNMLIATYDGQLWYPSLYDLDSTWGTYVTGLKEYDYKNDPFPQMSSLLFERMEKCFGQELAERYFELRQDILSEEHIMAEFAQFKDEVPPLVFVKEYVRWGTGAIRRREELPGAEYDQIAQFLAHRLPLLDEKYTAMAG